jgi:hypothetical protein
MKDKYIIIVILFLIAVLFLYNYQENITSDSGKTLSDEALQNIASVYGNKDGTVTFNNVKITGNVNSPTQKYNMKLQDDGNLCIYDVSGNKVSCMGTDGFINPTNPKLGFGDSKYYAALQTNGDMCVNNGKGAGGNLACVGNSGLLGVRLCDLAGTCIAPNNIQSVSGINNNGVNINGHNLTIKQWGSVPNALWVGKNVVGFIA